MSVRWFGSAGDPRIVEGPVGEWTCRKCRLGDGHAEVHLRSREELTRHLASHRAAGHRIPEGGFAELLAEGAPR